MLQGLMRVVLYCQDPKASRTWYEKAGFTYQPVEGFGQWFRLGAVDLMLHPARGPVQPGPAKYCAAVLDVDAHFRYVRENGFQTLDTDQASKVIDEPMRRPWGEQEFALRDPDGYVWAFVQRA